MGQAPNDKGEYISDIHKYNHESLETIHNYIQWIFPLAEPSENVPDTPYLDKDFVKNINDADYQIIKDNIIKSIDMMTEFYENSDYWLSYNDHNHLRITRIIKSLKLFKLYKLAENFYDHIMSFVYRKMPVSFETFEYWKEALHGKDPIKHNEIRLKLYQEFELDDSIPNKKTQKDIGLYILKKDIGSNILIENFKKFEKDEQILYWDQLKVLFENNLPEIKKDGNKYYFYSCDENENCSFKSARFNEMSKEWDYLDESDLKLISKYSRFIFPSQGEYISIFI